jgi:hypothetical protein
VIARTLAHRVFMRTNEREVFEAVRFLSCEPEIDVASAAQAVEIALTIVPFHGRYRVREEGRRDEEAIDLRSVVDRLHSRVLSISVQAKPEAGILHAASLRRGSRKFLLAGVESAGKTTLALRLILEGCELEGDEHVILDCDGVIARPRACRVKESSLALLPEFAEVISLAPFYIDPNGRKTFNVDPRMLGGTWCIKSDKVDRVIVLHPNHGGYSSLRSLPPTALAQALLSDLQLRGPAAGTLVAAVADLVRHAKGFDLSLGDHETAVMCINRALAD